MIELELTDERFVIGMPMSTPMEQLSACLQSGVHWFLGSGVHRFSVQRAVHKTDGRLVVKLETSVRPRRQEFGPAANLGALLSAGFVPAEIPLDDSWHYDLEKDMTPGFVFDMQDLDPDVTIAFIAWTLVDSILFFFLRGSKLMQYRISGKRAQLYVQDCGVRPDQYWTEENTFELGTPVSTIPS